MKIKIHKGEYEKRGKNDIANIKYKFGTFWKLDSSHWKLHTLIKRERKKKISRNDMKSMHTNQNEREKYKSLSFSVVKLHMGKHRQFTLFDWLAVRKQCFILHFLLSLFSFYYSIFGLFLMSCLFLIGVAML